jgi:lipooligosaccharide transport system permease protein
VAVAMRASSVYFLRFKNAGLSTMLVHIVNPLFVLGAMGVGLGSLIDDNQTASLGGVSYLAFIAPALMAAFAMQSAAGSSLWPVLGGLKWEGTYIGQSATPLRPVDVLRGQLTFTGSEIGVGVVCTFFAMVVYGAIESWWGVLAMPAALLTGMAYAAPITAFPLIMRLGVIPSYLFSGTFFPVSQLPDALEVVAKMTPLWHGVDLCRTLSLGTATLLGSLGHAAYLVVVVLVSLAWGRRCFERRLHQ